MKLSTKFSAAVGGALLGAALLGTPWMVANSQSPVAKTYWIIHQSGTDPDFRVTSSGDGRIEPTSAKAFDNPDRKTATRVLERQINEIHTRLAMDGFFALSKVGQDGEAFDLKAARIQPVNRIAPSAGPVMDGGTFIPPRAFRSTSNKPTVMFDWMAGITQGLDRGDGPENYHYAWRNTITPIAYMLANQAVMRVALQQIEGGGDKVRLWRPGDDRGDAVGSAIFNGTVIALTKYGSSEVQLMGHVTGSIKPYDFVYGYDFDDFRKRGIKEYGPTPAAILGISTTWADAWAGLPEYEYTSTNVAIGPITGVMASVLSNGGPGAVHAVINDPFPYKETSGGRSVKEWLGWLDGQIRKSGNKQGTWQGHTQFIAERGFAGAYVTALSDLIALPRRMENTAFTRQIPSSFVNGDYLDEIYKEHPCQDFSFSLNNPVQEMQITLPEVASRCIRVRWTGEGYGPGFNGPPVQLAVKGAGMTPEDYDSILIASSEGEMNGLTIMDQATRDAAKWWTMPYRTDLKKSEWMTLAIANVAPKVAETKPRTITVTLGTGLTSGSGAVKTVADASKAGSTDQCRPQTITSPPLYGPVAHPFGLQEQDGSLTSLLGLAARTKDSPLTNAAIQVAMCTAETMSGALNARNELAIGLQRDAPDASRQSCLGQLTAVTAVMSKEPKQPEVMGIELTPKGGAALDLKATTIPVEANVEIFDPSLAAARRSGKIDYRGNTSVFMEGVVTFQIRTDTRLRGRVDLKVPPKATLEQADCDGTASGGMTFVFDLVSALPFRENAVALPPDVLTTLNPTIWRMMSEAQKKEAIEEGRKARAEAMNASATTSGGTIYGGGRCDCSCTTFNDPTRNSLCAEQCMDFQVIAPQCVMDREVGRGRKRADLEKTLNACPSDCSALSHADPLCRESFPAIMKACSADLVTEADKACYLDLFSQDMPEPMKTQMRSEMQKQLTTMDQDTLRLVIRPQLEAFKEQGKKCPAD
ncbi:hypothetical protein K1X12_09670 [Hyphomonas sp. WL0036]|uniref:hypothetical protein n=1 Tax=Hyphomonas sediminis TaxID=2866160 RepID=UPI001C817ABC|nr:hypothetical protein [Hyphomonas sediminis]MBY9067166.1 hypothetical protein [Hyphomonas sediminis]